MELSVVDAMFATGAGGRILPISGVDRVALGSAGNALFEALPAGYRARTRDPRFLVAVPGRAAV
jgi:hypothetical protein